MAAHCWGQATDPGTIHVFVALCDNDHQGIVPVPRAIGNGDDSKNNLYWGCAGGLKVALNKDSRWRILSVIRPDSGCVLERIVAKHRRTGTLILADAYRGRDIYRAMRDFFQALSGVGILGEEVSVLDRPRRFASQARLLAYLGHNGLMDFKMEEMAVKRNGSGKKAMVLCCLSQRYFQAFIESRGAEPLLLTRQLMYPSAEALLGAIEGWIENEDRELISNRAAEAYAKNQKISKKTARAVFWP